MSNSKVLKSQVASSEESSIHNLPLVIWNWKGAGTALRVNGRDLKPSKDARMGKRYRPERTDLVIWIRLQDLLP